MIASHRDGALGMLLMGQSSAEAEHYVLLLGSETGGKSLSSDNGTSLGVSWSGGTLHQGRLVPLWRRRRWKKSDILQQSHYICPLAMRFPSKPLNPQRGQGEMIPLMLCHCSYSWLQLLHGSFHGMKDAGMFTYYSPK